MKGKKNKIVFSSATGKLHEEILWHQVRIVVKSMHKIIILPRFFLTILAEEQVIADMTNGGVWYGFDCTGKVEVIYSALESTQKVCPECNA